jgi:penicillin amidase
MPQVGFTKSGIIVNWNNKPAFWWPNLDTPVWGSPFRNEVLLKAIPSGKLDRFDLERAAWEIARRDSDTSGGLLDVLRLGANGDPALRYLAAYDGWNVDGSQGAVIYAEAVRRLRTELFQPSVGTFIQPGIFSQVVQPSLIKKAWEGETKYDYLAGRSKATILAAVLTSTLESLKQSQGDDPSLWSFSPGSILVRNQKPIPYINRGTYIQVTELSPVPVARSVASPGVAETGPHSADQADLARAWTYKPMWRLQTD